MKLFVRSPLIFFPRVVNLLLTDWLSDWHATCSHTFFSFQKDFGDFSFFLGEDASSMQFGVKRRTDDWREGAEMKLNNWKFLFLFRDNKMMLLHSRICLQVVLHVSTFALFFLKLKPLNLHHVRGFFFLSCFSRLPQNVCLSFNHRFFMAEVVLVESNSCYDFAKIDHLLIFAFIFLLYSTATYVCLENSQLLCWRGKYTNFRMSYSSCVLFLVSPS